MTQHPTSDLRWSRLRLALGMAQMGGVVVSLVLLLKMGAAPLSLAAVVITSALTSISVMLFGNRRGRHRGDV